MNNDLSAKSCNRCAFYHAVPTVLNAFFNNPPTASPKARLVARRGRQLYLGNVWSDISKTVFAHGKREDEQAQYGAYQL